MDMLTAVGLVVGVLFLIGLVGSVVPWLPGPLFILAGAVIWGFATGFAEIGIGRLAILAALALLTFLLNFVVGAVGARRYGGSRWGVVGALVGAVVGLVRLGFGRRGAFAYAPSILAGGYLAVVLSRLTA